MHSLWPPSCRSESRPFSWPLIILLDLFLLSLLILSTRMATFLHEAAGHALAAFAFGGAVSGVRLSLLGGGNAYYQFEDPLPLAAGFVVAFSGILINLLSGYLAFKRAGRPGTGPNAMLFLSLFGMVSLSGGLSYACLGFYYQVGDPVAWMVGPVLGGDWLWIPFFASSLLAAYAGIRFFVEPLQACIRGRGIWSRAAFVGLTLGITSCTYAGLYGLTRQRSVALETPSLAQMRAEEQLRKEKKEEILRRLREAHPDWTRQEVEQEVERIPVEVRPEEVPGKPPLVPLLAAGQILAALLGLRGLKDGHSGPGFRLSPGLLALGLILASAVLAALNYTGGWIWRAG